MKAIVSLLLLCLIALPLAAQMPSIPDQREAMKKLDFMVGQWKGEGWHERPPGPRMTFTQTETVQKKVDGLALLVEGKGTGNTAGKDGAASIFFEAMGVISYDDQARRYRFVSNTSEGRQGSFELKLTERGWEWGFSIPQGHVRYTMKLTDDGQWYEIGEFSQDEKTWRKFHEMTLRRM